jgi:hypothetical protein
MRFLESEHKLRELLVLGLAGDAAAYHDFLKALSAHLRAYFRRRLSQRMDEVEDLVQEVLIAVHNQRQTYHSDQPLTAWVHCIDPAVSAQARLLKHKPRQGFAYQEPGGAVDFYKSQSSHQ